jgi:HEAT repeat protein
VWALIHILQEREPLYEGQPLWVWLERAHSSDSALKSQARTVVDSEVIPRLREVMFQDTRDSRVRAWLAETLNNLPGVQVYYTPAVGRRMRAVQDMGGLGLLGRAAVPDLLRALGGQDQAVRPAAARALGQVGTDPQVAIPLLISLLDDPHEGVPESAVGALGDLGSQSRSALPRLLEMSKIQDKELHAAVAKALRQIDPDAAARAGFK